jgi:hypothetical protein
VDPSEWIARFRVTHEQSKKNQLTPEQRKTYLGMREELAKSLLAMQAMTVAEGQNARKAFRVAHVFAVEVNNLYRGMTRDISSSGFSATLPTELKVGQELPFTLTIAKGAEPLGGKAKVVSAVKQGSWRVSFQITWLTEVNAERLETALFDAVLSRFK